MKKTLISLLLVLLTLFTSCDTISMDYVPDKELVERHFQEFLTNSTEIKGIYGNQDVDCLIFKYTSDDESVLDTIQRQAAQKEWGVLKSNDRMLQLFRKYPPRGKDGAGPHSYELVKVHYNEQDRNVCVGWLQIDENYEVVDPDETGEGKWAKRNFWPEFDRCCRGSNFR